MLAGAFLGRHLDVSNYCPWQVRMAIQLTKQFVIDLMKYFDKNNNEKINI